MPIATETRNVALHLIERARLEPDKRAIVCADGQEADGRGRYRTLTYAELDAESDRIARGLIDMGVKRGDRVVVMIRPSLEFFSVVFGLFKMGGVMVLVDPGMGRRNLKTCLEDTEPSAFIGIPVAHAARVLLGWCRDTIRFSVTVGRRWFWGGPKLDQLVRNGSGAFESIVPEPDEMAAILFTSGSTGIPKGAVYTHEIFNAQIEFLRDQFSFDGEEIDLATFPLFALFDPGLGMTAVIPEMDASRPAEADPVKLIRAINDNGVTQMFGSPALVDRLSRYAVRNDVKLPTLKRVLSAGAPVRPDILERMRRLLGEDAKMFTPYGATEALPVASIESGEILGETAAMTAEGKGICVGLPVRQVRVGIIRIIDGAIETWSDDLQVSPGEIGEIVVEGPVVTRSYYGRTESTRLAKINARDGGVVYHRMGDVGYVDGTGRLWFCGRKNHRVETPEGTLFTIPVEGIFNAHPRVFRTALVGLGERGRHVPVLCVELEAEARDGDNAQLADQLRTLGKPYDHTKGIDIFLIHPGFPVDPRHNAKINREALALWAKDQMT